MSPSPVWVLSVDLQAKTATFATGMADAARAAKDAFGDIKTSAQEGGEGVKEGTTNVRAALGLLDNTIRGNHAAAMADLVREFSDTAFVMNALPFAAAAGGLLFVASVALDVAEKVKEAREETEKLAEAQTKMGTSLQNAFNELDIKLLEAGKETDELRNNHLGELQKELETINRQSMSELVSSFTEVAKAADLVFGEIKSHWYTFGIGAEGAKNALDKFQTEYASLLSQGKDKEAHDLLASTRDSAEKTLNAQRTVMNGSKGGREYDPTDISFLSAKNQLQEAGVGYSQGELQAQVAIVSALNAQLGVETRISAIKAATSGNASRSTAMGVSAESSAAARAAVDAQIQMAQETIAADRATAEARLTIANASAAEREAVEKDFAKREYDLALTGNAQQLAAADKLAKDYPNQVKALHEKALEAEQQYQTSLAEITAKGSVAANQKAVQDAEAAERQKIDATREGSAERLAAIQQAIQAEAALNQQSTDNYRGLLAQKVAVERQMDQDAAEQAANAGKISAENEEKMAQLRLAASQEARTVAESARRMSEQRQIADARNDANAQYALQMTGFAQQIAALDKYGKDYENKLRELQNRQKQLTQQHENQLTQIQDQATVSRNQQILGSVQKFESNIAQGLARTLLGQQSFASMMTSLGNQVAEGMIQNALQSMMALNMDQERSAAKAARMGWLAGMELPFPANIVAAPALAASMFAGVMAYENGGIVPGVGRGDTVPAMLTPGEGIVPGGVMDGLSKAAKSGTLGGSGDTHVHYRPTYHLHALDTQGMDKLLKKHESTIQKHVHNSLRKANK